MFLPLESKLNWTNPPLITLVLVLANILVFYIAQHNDDKVAVDINEHYKESGQDLDELRAYVRYKAKLQSSEPSSGSGKGIKVTNDTFYKMRLDGEFQHKLANELIIKPGDPDYNSWRLKRDIYEQLQAGSFSSHYSFNPSKPQRNYWSTTVSSLFLHGDAGHLYGNILLLLFLGLGIEILIGRLWFLLGYLVAGICGNLLSLFANAGTNMDIMGASGAISGVMGMAIIIYGFRKINFFYFLIFYFNVIKASAIWLLPVYLLSQAIIEILFTTNTSVTSHIGGLFGGLAFMGLIGLLPNSINQSLIDEPQKKSYFEQKFTEAMSLIASMEIDKARTRLQELNKHYPNDVRIIEQLFNLAKYDPSSEDYHTLALKLLALSGSDKRTTKIIHSTYRHYATNAKPKARWTSDLLINMALKFITIDELKDAENIINSLLKSMPDFARNADGLAALAKYYKEVEPEKHERYKFMLQKMYPNNDLAKHV